MNIEELIMNGASEEEIMARIAEIQAEKARQEAALRAEQEQEAEKKSKEALKAEGRAYLVNAMVAYAEAFDLLPEDYVLEEEELEEVEKLLIEVEEAIPLYVKMMGLEKKLKEMFGEDMMPDSFF